jgi:hypothetical protein
VATLPSMELRDGAKSLRTGWNLQNNLSLRNGSSLWLSWKESWPEICFLNLEDPNTYEEARFDLTNGNDIADEECVYSSLPYDQDCAVMTGLRARAVCSCRQKLLEGICLRLLLTVSSTLRCF